MSNSSLFCSACCKVHEQGMFYQCNTCVTFFIHKDCASFAYIIDHPSHQGHPLHLGYHLDGTQKRNDCDICYKKIYEQSGWFYYCWECKFYSHLSCITSDYGQEILEIDPKIPSLPWEEADNEFGTVGLLNRMSSIQNDDEKGSEIEKINHFSHPEHLLILHYDIPKEANPFSDGEMTLTTQCNGCCKQISAPLYSCADCQFYLHKGCALLPTYITQHHAHSCHHPFRLVLARDPWYETRALKCDDCKEYYNGFSYQCEEESCEYQIDAECAFLPSTIVHKAHPFHTLSLVDKEEDKSRYEEKMYNCCDDLYNGGYIYKCDACKFQIHPRCAMYPSKAHHRFDCDSPFMLCYSPSKIEPNEYHYCDICEELLYPKLWFYFSSKMGGTIMHPGCLLLSDSVAVDNPNFKSISSILEVDIHPHRLHCYPAYKFNTCYLCEDRMIYHNNKTIYDEQPIGFEYRCVESGCEYQMHISCGNRFILPAEETAKETAVTVQHIHGDTDNDNNNYNDNNNDDEDKHENDNCEDKDENHEDDYFVDVDEDIFDEVEGKNRDEEGENEEDETI